MMPLLLSLTLAAGSTEPARGAQADAATLSRGGMSLTWGQNGAALHVGTAEGIVRWQISEPVIYQPEYLARLKLFVVVSRQDESLFHIWAVSGASKMLTRIDVPTLPSATLAAVATADTIAFPNPGLFARAPTVGEKNLAWLKSREQLDVYSYVAQTGEERWHFPELQIGQPLAGSVAFLWTVRLTNPQDAYAGAKPKYEIDQVGAFSGKVARAWPFPGEGGDLEAYRWKAELHGADCTLKRLELWPDAEPRGNLSPPSILLRKVAGGKISGKRRVKTAAKKT